MSEIGDHIRPVRNRASAIRAAIAALAALAALFLVTPRRWMTVNDVTTGQTGAYPEIQPRVYQAAPDQVYDAALTAIERLHRWKVARQDRHNRRIEAEATIWCLVFTDDVTVWIEADGAGSRVMIRSHSRVGRGDLGENARSIRALQRQIDRILAPES